jgi:predicted DNA-binding transcriptional regulator AlpA
MTKFLCRPAVAERIGVHAQSVKRYVEDPRYLKFPKPVLIGGRPAFVESEIEAWQQERIAERDAKSPEAA